MYLPGQGSEVGRLYWLSLHTYTIKTMIDIDVIWLTRFLVPEMQKFVVRTDYGRPESK